MFSAQTSWLFLGPRRLMRTRFAGNMICIRCKSEWMCLSLFYIVGQGTIIIESSLEPLSKELKHFKLTPYLTFISSVFSSKAPSSGHAKHQISFCIHQEYMLQPGQCRLDFSLSSPIVWLAVQAATGNQSQKRLGEIEIP